MPIVSLRIHLDRKMIVPYWQAKLNPSENKMLPPVSRVFIVLDSIWPRLIQTLRPCCYVWVENHVASTMLLEPHCVVVKHPEIEEKERFWRELVTHRPFPCSNHPPGHGKIVSTSLYVSCIRMVGMTEVLLDGQLCHCLNLFSKPFLQPKKLFVLNLSLVLFRVWKCVDRGCFPPYVDCVRHCPLKHCQNWRKNSRWTWIWKSSQRYASTKALSAY